MSEIRNTQQKVDLKSYGESYDRIFGKEKENEVTIFKINTRCPHCRKNDVIEVEDTEWIKYDFEGVLIQQAFPNLSSVQREQILSGICGPCWDKILPEEDDD